MTAEADDDERLGEALPRTASIPAKQPERLLDLDLRITNHLAPLLDLVTLQHGERLDAADQIGTERAARAVTSGSAERVCHLLVEAGDDPAGAKEIVTQRKKMERGAP